MTDHEAYEIYPEDRIWYNKLHVAKLFGYRAGTLRVPITDTYIVRPICNLNGCGIDAIIRTFTPDELIKDGLFWCEIFTGRHITIDYQRINNQWIQMNAFEGINTPDNLIEFKSWQRVDYPYPLPPVLHTIQSDNVNLELIDGKIIEIHMRHNSDPTGYDTLIPVWERPHHPPDVHSDWQFIIDQQSHLHRIGFYVK